MLCGLFLCVPIAIGIVDSAVQKNACNFRFNAITHYSSLIAHLFRRSGDRGGVWSQRLHDNVVCDNFRRLGSKINKHRPVQNYFPFFLIIF